MSQVQIALWILLQMTVYMLDENIVICLMRKEAAGQREEKRESFHTSKLSER